MWKQHDLGRSVCMYVERMYAHNTYNVYLCIYKFTGVEPTYIELWLCYCFVYVLTVRMQHTSMLIVTRYLA